MTNKVTPSKAKTNVTFADLKPGDLFETSGPYTGMILLASGFERTSKLPHYDFSWNQLIPWANLEDGVVYFASPIGRINEVFDSATIVKVKND